MIDAPSSTWFSASPHWGWHIVLYFVFGGLAGGCYLLAVLIDLLGRPEDRPLARRGYYVVLPCLIVSGILLILDLTRMERFWHLLVENHTWRPMFKSWSPMSIGSWALLAFGLFAFASFLGALAESGRLRWSWAARLRPPGTLGTAIAAIGGLLGLYVAGYTGVLLAVTNRPIWSDTPLLGMLLVVSAMSISSALMILLARRARSSTPTVRALHRIDVWVLVLEFLVLLAFLVSLGPVVRGLLNVHNLVLLLSAILIGMAAPLALYWRRDWLGERTAGTAAVLILAGGFLLRTMLVFSPEWVGT